MSYERRVAQLPVLRDLVGTSFLLHEKPAQTRVYVQLHPKFVGMDRLYDALPVGNMLFHVLYDEDSANSIEVANALHFSQTVALRHAHDGKLARGVDWT